MNARSILETLIPVNGNARMVLRMLRDVAREPRSWPARLNSENIGSFMHFRRQRFVCPVCGQAARPLFDFPDLPRRREHRIGTLRETLQCQQCFAPMRLRSLAIALLQHLNERWGTCLASVAELASTGLRGLRVLDSDNFSAIGTLLREHEGYVRCSYLPEQPWGTQVSPGYFNIDLQRIDFPDKSFDVVLTSDVMEHVRDCNAAHAEIRRVLRPGGAYVFNVPYDESSARNIELVDTSTETDVYLCPPQLHGDPLTGGVLAYRVFGRELIDRLTALGFAVRFMRLDRPEALVLDGDVFLALKQG